MEAVNRERKLGQMEVQRELSGYETQWGAALAKNREIKAACAELAAELTQVQAQLPAQCAVCPSPRSRLSSNGRTGAQTAWVHNQHERQCDACN
jgi:hypothetical protein